MVYDPKIHHRRSIRMPGYDYSQPGGYFITIVTQAREPLFGQFIDGQMQLNSAGDLIQRWLFECEPKFPNIKIDKQIIMPDHVHVIMTINDLVGADLRVRPNDSQKRRTIPEIVQWFKTMTTNDYIRNVKENGWREFEKRLWQRDYYEHVIRDEKDYAEVWEYIESNPTAID